MNLRFGILTISDRSASGKRTDASGPALANAVLSKGWQITQDAIVPDVLGTIKDLLVSWVDSGDLDVILTTGGTGFSPRDVTPEATEMVIEREAPGISEAMRAASLKVTPHAMLSRGLAGTCGKTLIINLPGSPKAAKENLEVVIPVLEHAVQLLRDDPAAEMGH
jgi:molybdopterin adenylyltransferase